MGEMVTLKSADGFEFSAYRSMPEGEPRSGVVVIQEIFGVNQHIREVTDGFAADGYAAIAPAIFDRAERGVELGYDQEGIAAGAGIAFGKLKMEETLQDLGAAVRELKQYGRVGTVGYCFGGLLAYLSSCTIEELSCAVGYYGGGIANVLEQKPHAPLMLHFGELDAHIPLSDVEKIQAALPDVPVYTYDADHGFSCDHRESYNAAAANEARDRTIRFFAQHLGT